MKVLDKGFVELMVHTPEGDKLVVNAARCSFDKQIEEFGDKDEKLINYLAREKHLLPFRHPVVTLRLHLPIFVLRQLGKSQVGFSWSEVSRRYIKTEPEFYEPAEWRKAAANVKQGSEGAFARTEGVFFERDMSIHYDRCSYLYGDLLKEGVCAEQARMVLPQSMYTTTVTTGSLLGWNHMWKQRTDLHTQKETRDYAKAIGNIMAELYPVSWLALCTDGKGC